MRQKIIALTVATVLLVFLLCFMFYKNSMLEREISNLKEEKIKLLEEHGECLKYKENSLKKELIEKYLDSMIALRNRMEKGYIPNKQDLDNFFDRSSYIVDNLGVYEPSKEEISQHLLFISSMKTMLEPFIKSEKELKKE